MKRLMILAVVGVMAFGLAACNSIPFLSAKNQLESVVAVVVAGTYIVNITKDGKTLYTETWNCTKDDKTGKLTGCHKISETPVNPIAPVQ